MTPAKSAVVFDDCADNSGSAKAVSGINERANNTDASFFCIFQSSFMSGKELC